MKKLYHFAALFCLTVSLHAQIPNAGFENWSGLNPVGWISNDVPTIDTPVAQSTNSHNGIYAVRLGVGHTSGTTTGGTLITDNNGSAFYPLSSLPGALHGWYMGNVANTGDELSVSSDATFNSSPVAFAAGTITQSSAVYKEFIFNFDTLTGSIVDSFDLSMIVANTSTSVSPATYFIVDDLSFGSASTGISEVNDNAVLETCSPNPATGPVNIIYSISSAATVGLALYDITGQKVKTLLKETDQAAGRYKIPADLSDLASGIYIYTMIADGRAYSQKLVVAK